MTALALLAIVATAGILLNRFYPHDDNHLSA